ncbi:nuclear transport factor 2 family protein [Mucilaginibacter aquaedulcis]|uniref:nuclear transport factor 2 family protein n=1 Tax=Mucilaginibacter aquaedulcis TaxID=1187081 RepID=UPI0025B4E03E|nr:nuclear transport factor 2 family protein [Mucilaginibacter aquaedulcis]MDN3550042.1 nuclear transport factor 2 family protein [Mucilaginibacter aquaedulcis]
MKNSELEQIAQQFIAAANRFDTQAVLELFAADAVIEDVSVGDRFKHTEGIRKYFVTFFIGYHTSTKLLSLDYTGPDQVLAKVDFTGDFGHETGGLDIRVNDAGLIAHIDAYLD